MNGNRSRVKSDVKARISNMTAPVTFGANNNQSALLSPHISREKQKPIPTVNRFVLMALYPNLPTICGRNSDTLCSGTPKHTSMASHAHATGSLNTLSDSFRLNFSSTMEELSTWMRWKASSFSASLRKRALAALMGRYHQAKKLKRTVQEPSMRKRKRHEGMEMWSIWKTPNARRPGGYAILAEA